MTNGGYEAGYQHCSCFWGKEPGRLVRHLNELIEDFADLTVLDAGCGEGKNAAYLAGKGAKVSAVEVSEVALQHARQIWSNHQDVDWIRKDVRLLNLEDVRFNIVIAYGLVHCFDSEEEISDFIKKVKIATESNGYNIICAYNSRSQDLSAHPDASPTIMSHGFYENLYQDWDIVISTDEDLHETHPHNGIPHTHSMTRILARCPDV